MSHLQKTKLVTAIGGVLLALSASFAHAAGLGKLSVSSSLGQPLAAEIELVALLPGEFEALSARVASPEAYTDAKIEYVVQLRQLRFGVERRADGKPILKITSAVPITDPFLDVLVELSWPSGRLVREYPILLDPPGFDGARVTAPAVATVTSTIPPVAVATPLPVQPSVGAPLAEPARGDAYGPVKRGDTLGKIAAEFKPDTVSMEQMLVALYRENKEAFSGGNMNRLKTGQIIRIPSADEVAKIARVDAQKEVRVQVSDWKTYRDAVAGAVAAAPAKAASPIPSKESTGKIAAAKPAPPPAAAASDQLKIGKPDAGAKPGTAATTAGKAAAADAAKENKIASDKTLAETKSRIAELEKQAADAKKLIEMKAAPPAKPEAPKLATAAPVAAKPGAPAAVGSTPSTAPAPTASGSAPTPAASGSVPPVASAGGASVPAKAPPKVAAKAPPPPPPEPSLMDTVTDNIVPIGGGTLGVVGIGGLLLWMRRKKKSTASSTGFSQTSSLMPSDMKANSSTGNKAGGLVDTGNSSFLTDFDKTGPGAIDTDEVDPVAEAEVYIAYGRDAQAEEILKEAMTRDKSRHEIAVKLLEIYHARKSAAAFETVARELKDSVGEGSPLWAKAAAMGASIDPTNSLYAGANSNYEATAAFAAGGTAIISASAAAAMSSPDAKPDLDFDLGFDSPAPDVAVDITSATLESGGAGGAGMDFDLSLDTGEHPAVDMGSTEPSADAGGLDFDLAFDPSPAPSAAVAPAAVAPAAPSDEMSGFDFDLSALSLDLPTDDPSPAAAAPAPSAPATSAFSLGDLSLDLESFGSETAPAAASPSDAGSGGDAAAATKLELAKAYIEIGDSEGAREILNEVAREGSAAQQEEAKKILSEI